MLLFRRLLKTVRKLNTMFLFIFTCCVIVCSSVGMTWIEPKTFPTFMDGLWWTMTTMATVGYGDLYPTTMVGRIFAIGVYIVGIGLLGVILGKIVDSFGLYARLREEGKLKFRGENHVILLGWSKKAEITVEKILEKEKEVEIVLIDEEGKTPFVHERFHYVQGDPTLEKTAEQANFSKAKAVIIYADDRIDNSLLIDGKTLLLASAVESYAPHAKTIVEIRRRSHLKAFAHVKVDEVIVTNEHVSNIAIQHLQK